MSHPSAIAEVALNGLTQRDVALLRLRYAEQFSCAEVAARLGDHVGNVYVRLVRARERFEAAVRAAVLLADPPDCAVFASLTSTAPRTLTPLHRKRINRHLRGCDTCASRLRVTLDSTALLSAISPRVVAGEC